MIRFCRALLWAYGALSQMCRDLSRIYRARWQMHLIFNCAPLWLFVRISRALLRIYRALLRIFRALLYTYLIFNRDLTPHCALESGKICQKSALQLWCTVYLAANWLLQKNSFLKSCANFRKSWKFLQSQLYSECVQYI